MATCRLLRWASTTSTTAAVDRAALEDPLLVAKSLQALARRRSNNTGAWKGHLQRALEVAHKADAQAAARVLNACSRSPLGELATQVAEAYQDRAQRLLPQSSARQLATAANAMARMLIRDEEYIFRLSRELRMKFEKCNTFQASLIANSYARLMVVERTLFGQLLPAYAKAHGHRFRVKDLALVLNAYAKAQLRSTAVFDALKERCREQTQHMDCQALSMIAAAHAKLLITDEVLFQTLAWRLRSCARTCTFQAVANLANAYAKFGFTSPVAPDAQPAASLSHRRVSGAVGITDAVFDLVLEELPRLLADSNAHSLVLLSHAAARAGQHHRLPALPQRLSTAALQVLDACDGAQLGMLSVAFAELWPMETEEGFWLALAEAATNSMVKGELSIVDAANCGVAFAAAKMPPEHIVAALQPSQYVQASDVSPQTACALVLTHAYAGLWAPKFLEAMTRQMPELLWQATDSVACRWALAFCLSGTHLPAALKVAVEQYVMRQAKALAEGVEADLDEASLIAACQGVAALLMPFGTSTRELGTVEALEVSTGPVWLEVTGPSHAHVHCAPHAEAAAMSAGHTLAERLWRKPRLARLLHRLANPSVPSTLPVDGSRWAGLRALLLPSVKPPKDSEELPQTLAAGRRLSGFLRRHLHHETVEVKQHGAVVAMMLKVPGAEVPMVLILDDELTTMVPGEADAGLRLHPDAELHGWLLAKDALVLRLPAPRISELCTETGSAVFGAVTVDSHETSDVLPPFAGWLQDLGRTWATKSVEKWSDCGAFSSRGKFPGEVKG